ncbi:MAG: homocysteine biosynthesis protein, partial [Cyanobacteria bacterium P01_D01_bin.50]
MRTIAEINDKINRKKAVVLTVEELKAKVAQIGVAKVAKQVDAIATGTFEQMESSGAIINLGHTDPPIKIRRCWLDGVPAYSGFGAVDLYLGASSAAEPPEGEEVRGGNTAPKTLRGGGHVIEDLIAGKPVQVRAQG